MGHEGDVTKVTAQVETNANTCLKYKFLQMARFQSFRFSNSKRVWVEQLTVKVTLCHPAVYAVCIPMHFGHLLKTMYFIFYLQYIILYQAISFNQGAQNLKKCHKWHNDSCSSWVNNWLLFTVERHANLRAQCPFDFPQGSPVSLSGQMSENVGWMRAGAFRLKRSSSLILSYPFLELACRNTQ